MNEAEVFSDLTRSARQACSSFKSYHSGTEKNWVSLLRRKHGPAGAIRRR
jgi:hypothetical protein